MFGQLIVQAIGAPVTGIGFLQDAYAANLEQSESEGDLYPVSLGDVLFLEVPGSGLGSDTPSFSLIATGTLSAGVWGFDLNFSLPMRRDQEGVLNAPVNSVIASATTHPLTTKTFSFEADVTVVNGIPTGTWVLKLNGVQDSTGSLTNFPLVPYPTQPANGEFSTTTKIRRTLAMSLDVTALPNGATLPDCVLQVSQAGYNGPVVTVNNR